MSVSSIKAFYSQSRAAHSTLGIIALAFCAFFALSPAKAQTALSTARATKIVYVVPGGAGDGSSWADAMGNVSNAYAAAAAFAEGGFDAGEVWIKAGRYTVAETITLQSGVAVRGGFLGTETDASAASRDNLTILSGDKGNDNYWMPMGTGAVPTLYVWTGDDKMTFNPPNPDGSDEYWTGSRGGSGYDYNGFQNLAAPVTNGAFTGLTFTGFQSYAIRAQYGAIGFVVSNCNFYACALPGSNAVSIEADATALVQDCVFWGGRGLRISAGATEVRTNRIADCVFRDLTGIALRLWSADNLSGHRFDVDRCRFFRNYTSSGADAPAVHFSQGLNSCNDYRFTDTVFEDCRMRGDSTGLFNSNGNYGGSMHHFLRCDFIGNTNRNSKSSLASAVCTGRQVSMKWHFRDCGFYRNALFYVGSGYAGTLYASSTANNYALFANCTLAANTLEATGETKAKVLGTLVNTSPHCRLSVVNSLLRDNAVSGSADCVGDVTEWGTGYNAYLQVFNSVLESGRADYVPLCVSNAVAPYLLASFMRNFDAATAGCKSFRRCERITTAGDTHLSPMRLRPPAETRTLQGATPLSPFWRGGVDVRYPEGDPFGNILLFRDPDFHGTRYPWRNMTVLSGSETYTDAAAAALGISLDTPLLPDALGYRRKAGKVAYGPLNYPYPTVLDVR